MHRKAPLGASGGGDTRYDFTLILFVQLNRLSKSTVLNPWRSLLLRLALALATCDVGRWHRLRAAHGAGGQHRAAAEHFWLGQNLAGAASIVVLLGVHDMPDPGWLAGCQIWCATGPRPGGVTLLSLLAAVGVGVTNIALGFVWS